MLNQATSTQWSQCCIWNSVLIVRPQVGVKDWRTGASPVKATAVVGGGKRSGEAEGIEFVSFWEERNEGDWIAVFCFPRQWWKEGRDGLCSGVHSRRMRGNGCKLLQPSSSWTYRKYSSWTFWLISGAGCSGGWWKPPPSGVFITWGDKDPE